MTKTRVVGGLSLVTDAAGGGRALPGGVDVGVLWGVLVAAELPVVPPFLSRRFAHALVMPPDALAFALVVSLGRLLLRTFVAEVSEVHLWLCCSLYFSAAGSNVADIILYSAVCRILSRKKSRGL